MFDFSLMKNDGSNETISVRCGEVTFFVGGNGTGKSSLVNSIYRRHANNNSVYVVAHRKNTFDNDIIDFSNSDYKNATQRIFNDSMSQTSRYRTHWENEKAALPIVKIKNKVTAHAVTNMKNLKNGGKLEEITLDSEIDLVNDIFKNSGFNLEFIIDEESNLMVNNLNYDPVKTYTLSKMSDGEKSALIICCEVLCANSGALIVLDEPERHLHKRIVSPLLSNLIEARRDCAFVISTHELTLPSFFKESTVVSINSCTYENDEPTQWNISVIRKYDEALNGLDEQVKADILGARNNMLFVEGTQASLDAELYGALFSNASVISKEKCDLVEQAVKGLRNNTTAHWVNAVGIIDNDNKVQSQIENLNLNFVFSLSVHSIESIYYHPKIIRWVLCSVKDTNLTSSVDECFDKVCEIIRSALEEKKEHLCCRAIEKKIRAEVMSSIPTQKEIREGGTYSKEINFSSLLNDEIGYFDNLMHSSDFDSLVGRYPIRETNFLVPVAKQCGFIDRKRYELNVIRVIRHNSEARNFVLSLLGGAAEALAN
ncbi:MULTISPECIES: AAA family ATPase [Serratia]|nr:AAA family ATPase [Serratia marcescens]AXX18943.1 ATP-binding protein [Serratia marcescens]AXX23639.1 ATP-binding protein [Serratia marcescens]MDP8859991.1 AAA family ATPase [Serratia marcescens]RTE96176.1 ATP-binding protein [Serratia marcescens]RTE98246.1 ATP-binding protein [Serratia marcescens]